MSEIVRPVKPVPSAEAPSLSEVDSLLADTYPCLWGFLVSRQYVDGSDRETGTLTVFGQDGAVKGCLRDRAGHRVLFVTGATLEAVLASADTAVEMGVGDWRPDRPPTGPRRK